MGAASTPLRTYLREVTATVPADDEARGRALAAVAVHLGRAAGIDLVGADLRLLEEYEPAGGPGLVPAPPTELATPWLLGAVHAALLRPTDRRRGGVFITPEPVAERITASTLRPGCQRVCDPAVGGGAFLLAAARHMADESELPLSTVVGQCVFGSDVDPLAVAVAECALSILGWDDGPPPGLRDHLLVGDPLTDPALLPAPFDAVVGNPPFLNQLETATARSRVDAAAARDRFGAAAGGYADGAALFLLLGLELVRPGGRVGMILPDSVLAARDARAARRAVIEKGSIESVWLGGPRVFDAGVSVCAVVAEAASPQREKIAVTAASTFAPRAPVAAGAIVRAPSWSALMADAQRVPDPVLRTDGTVGDRCRVTADFRDQFYGLAPLVEDAGDAAAAGGCRAPVITCGLIDPGRVAWGRRQTRIGGRRFLRPAVDVERLASATSLGPWARRRLVPKILVATQTRIIEAAVDADGAWVPSTPVITVELHDPAQAWHMAAALMAPPVSALALRSCAGAALAPDAIKLTARQVAALPLPEPSPAWDTAAAAVRRAATASDDDQWLAALLEAGAAMGRAYGVTDPAVFDWWSRRLLPKTNRRSKSTPECGD